MQVGSDLNWNEDKGKYLTRVQAQECSDIYRTEINRINRHLAQKFPTAPLDLEARHFVERSFLPAAEHIERSDLVEFYDRLTVRWFARPVEGAKPRSSASA